MVGPCRHTVGRAAIGYLKPVTCQKRYSIQHGGGVCMAGMCQKTTKTVWLMLSITTTISGNMVSFQTPFTLCQRRMSCIRVRRFDREEYSISVSPIWANTLLVCTRFNNSSGSLSGSCQSYMPNRVANDLSIAPILAPGWLHLLITNNNASSMDSIFCSATCCV